MIKVIRDTIYYYRRGFRLATAWRLARRHPTL